MVSESFAYNESLAVFEIRNALAMNSKHHSLCAAFDMKRKSALPRYLLDIIALNKDGTCHLQENIRHCWSLSQCTGVSAISEIGTKTSYRILQINTCHGSFLIVMAQIGKSNYLLKTKYWKTSLRTVLRYLTWLVISDVHYCDCQEVSPILIFIDRRTQSMKKGFHVFEMVYFQTTAPNRVYKNIPTEKHTYYFNSWSYIYLGQSRSRTHNRF